MDEEVIQEIDLEEFVRPTCPVKVGDRIYRKIKNMTLPDRMQIIELIPHKTGYYFKVKYMYHTIGPFERTFSDVIFKDDSWVIEKKGIDF